jgi:4-hydroxybenzoate polyprenyltransferase
MYVIGLLLHVKSHQSLGIILSSPYNLLAVILGGTAILSAFLSAVWFNDLFDLKIDRVSNPNRPLPSGQLSSHAVVIIAVSLFVYSILCAVPLGSHVVSLILCCNGIAFIYSSPPLRLRRYFPMSTMAIGLCSSMAMIVGFYLLNGNHVIIPSYEYFLIPLGIAFVSTFKDIKDVEGDSVDASYSLANILPPLYGRCATAVCVFIGINILFACFVERVLHPIGVVLGIVGAVLISTLPKPDKIPVAVYLVLMIMLLVYHML